MALTNLVKTGATAANKGPSCTVCAALSSLPDAEAAALRQLLADPAWRYTELADRLAEDPDTPLLIPHGTLARHAKGRCSAREKLR